MEATKMHLFAGITFYSIKTTQQLKKKIAFKIYASKQKRIYLFRI